MACSACGEPLDLMLAATLRLECTRKECGLHSYHHECVVDILDRGRTPHDRKRITYLKRQTNANLMGYPCPSGCGGKIKDMEHIARAKHKRDPPPVIVRRPLLPAPSPPKKIQVKPAPRMDPPKRLVLALPVHARSDTKENVHKKPPQPRFVPPPLYAQWSPQPRPPTCTPSFVSADAPGTPERTTSRDGLSGSPMRARLERMVMDLIGD